MHAHSKGLFRPRSPGAGCDVSLTPLPYCPCRPGSPYPDYVPECGQKGMHRGGADRPRDEYEDTLNFIREPVPGEDRRAAADVEEEEVPKKKASGFDTLSPLAKARLEASGQRPDTRSAIEPRKDPMDGSQVNARSSKAGAAAGNVVVTTVAPTNISAPTSTSVSSQTNISPGAVRRRRPMRARMAQSYS